MTPSSASPTALQRRARVVMELTRIHWGLDGRRRTTRSDPVRTLVLLPCRAAAAPQPSALVDREHWPYWPAYPGAAVGWR